MSVYRKFYVPAERQQLQDNEYFIVCLVSQETPVVDRHVAIALTMKLGLHATQPQASLWIRFHLSCVRLDKVTNAIYSSNFKNWSTLSPYLFVHFTNLHQVHGVYKIKEKNMGCSKVLFSNTRKLCPVMVTYRKSAKPMRKIPKAS